MHLIYTHEIQFMFDFLLIYSFIPFFIIQIFFLTFIIILLSTVIPILV